jgi:peroxiredoxin
MSAARTVETELRALTGRINHDETGRPGHERPYPDVWRLNRPGYCTDMTDLPRNDDRNTAGDAVPGEPAPTFASPASTGKTLSLDDFTGVVPLAVTFVGTLPRNEAEAVIEAFNAAFPDFGRHRSQLLIVAPEGPAAVRARRLSGTTVPLLADEDGRLLERFASSATFPATVLIDEAGTVRRVLEGGTPHDHLAAVLAATAAETDQDREESTDAATSVE